MIGNPAHPVMSLINHYLHLLVPVTVCDPTLEAAQVLMQKWPETTAEVHSLHNISRDVPHVLPSAWNEDGTISSSLSH